MPKPPTKVSAVNKSGVNGDHDPSDIRQQTQQEASQGVVRDERGQEQPADKKRAQQNTGTPQVSQSGQSSGYSSGEKKKGAS